MKKKPDTNSVVAKSNTLIEKMAKFDLSELRLIAYCVAHYDSRNPDNCTFMAHVEDLARLFYMDEKSAYAVVRRAMLGINQKPLEFEKGREVFFWNWFSGFSYVRGEGTFKFRITPEVRPYLLGLQDTFTKYRLGDVYQFRSSNTWKLYENLKRWENKGCWTVELNELRHLMGVEGKYPRWSDFQIYIINRPLKEINTVSDLHVTYEKSRRGRKIQSLTFRIKGRASEGTIDVDTPQQALYQGLLKMGINGQTAFKYTTDAEKFGVEQQALAKLPLLKERWEKKGKNGALQAYVLGALKDDIYQTKLFEGSKAEQQRNNALASQAIACYEEHGRRCNTNTDSKKCQICKLIN